MAHRSLFLALALPLTLGFAALGVSAGQAAAEETLAAPVLRANVTVNSDLVLIGDVIDNAGVAAKIAIFRAPDLGTTGAVPTARLLSALRAHRVIGVDTRDIREVMVTRGARKLDGQEIENEVLRALARNAGRTDANFNLKFDRDPQTMQLDPSNVGTMEPVAVRHDARSGRFEVSFEIADETGLAPTKLRFTGTAIETVEAAVLVRGLERNEVVKASDVTLERRPKAEVGGDVLGRDGVIGMQARRSLRAGQPLRGPDLGKPDLVQRDQGVTLTYETTGIYLTVRGKAMENGAEGDVVNVVNLQSKRTVSGIVIGRGQVSISAAQPRIVAAAQVAETVPAAASVARQPE